MRLDLWGELIVFAQQRNPHKMLRSCHKTMGPSPLWLGMKGQMMPAPVCVVTHTQHTCIFICIYTFFNVLLSLGSFASP